MIDLVLFAGRILLVIMLYLFLLATMKTGIGLAACTSTSSAPSW